MEHPTSPDLASVSFAYPAVRGDDRAGIAAALAGTGTPSPGTFVLSTCLRAEVLVQGDRSRLDEVVSGLVGARADVAGAEVRTGAGAATHLFRVAAGLESPVRGEAEILAQVRQAVRVAKEREGTDGSFARLLEAAVAAGRAARERLPVSPHDSLAAVAAQVVGDREAVAVLGGGAMAAAVVDALLGLPAPPRVTVLTRNPAAFERHGAEVWPFERAAEAVAAFPAVVSATSAKHRPIADDDVATALASRRERLLLVDMAMPPDFARPAEPELARYVGIDDLAAMAGRRSADDGADEEVGRRAGEAWLRFSRHRHVGPVIERIVAGADEVVSETVARFAGRLQNGDDQAVLRQAAHTVARTLLAGPLGYLNGARSPSDVEAVAEAFGADG